jgi:hypothetical protein
MYTVIASPEYSERSNLTLLPQTYTELARSYTVFCSYLSPMLSAPCYFAFVIGVSVTGPKSPDSIGSHADASNIPFFVFCFNLAAMFTL